MLLFVINTTAYNLGRYVPSSPSTKELRSRPLFLYFLLFNTVNSKQMFNIIFADDWIQTADLWYWKRPTEAQPMPNSGHSYQNTPRLQINYDSRVVM